MLNLDERLLEYHRDQYLNEGSTILNNVITTSCAKKWSDLLLSSNKGTNVFLAEADRTIKAGKGDNKHIAFDRFVTDEVLEDMFGLYKSILPILVKVISSEAILSPYERSAYYAKIYYPPDCRQGWHFDTNEITGLLYLTNHEKDGETEIKSLTGDTILVKPEAGSLLLLNGKECWHQARSVLSENKVIVVFDYYLAGHKDRLPHLDGLIFGG